MKSTQEIGKMIKETDLALVIMQMEPFMKVIGWMIISMAKELMKMLIEIFI